MQPSLVIAGLGNPGREYGETRHNAGFLAIDVLADAFGEGEWKMKQRFLSGVMEARVVTAPILLVKPQTFMNRSGEALKKIIDFHKLKPASQLLVLCDDVDLPLAEIRYRKRGGPGTHNGMKSVVEHFGEDFARIRVGLGTPPVGSDLATWVLSRMSEEERAVLDEAFKKLPEMVRRIVVEESIDP